MIRHALLLGRLLAKGCALALLLSITSCSSDFFIAPEKSEIGWIEQVSFPDFTALLDAKLDTGADTSSLHADNIRMVIGNDGDERVEFRVEDHSGNYQMLQLPLSRKAKIKTKKGSLQIRPVVTLAVCVGDRFQEVEFTLVDRSHFEYPVLIGRNFLAGKFLVDSSRSYTVSPLCGSTTE
ncbi:RimK/LysX family protein [bacterium]|nr:RimK/LysX family protein [bacterium]